MTTQTELEKRLQELENGRITHVKETSHGRSPRFAEGEYDRFAGEQYRENLLDAAKLIEAQRELIEFYAWHIKCFEADYQHTINGDKNLSAAREALLRRIEEASR